MKWKTVSRCFIGVGPLFKIYFQILAKCNFNLKETCHSNLSHANYCGLFTLVKISTSDFCITTMVKLK